MYINREHLGDFFLLAALCSTRDVRAKREAAEPCFSKPTGCVQHGYPNIQNILYLVKKLLQKPVNPPRITYPAVPPSYAMQPPSTWSRMEMATGELQVGPNEQPCLVRAHEAGVQGTSVAVPVSEG